MVFVLDTYLLEDGVCSLHVVEHEVFVLGLCITRIDDGRFSLAYFLKTLVFVLCMVFLKMLFVLCIFINMTMFVHFMF